MEFPEPTRKEARALILGLGNFWAFFALTCITGIFAPKSTALPLCITVLALLWLYFRGVCRIAARTYGVSVRRFILAPIARTGGPLSWLGIMSPTYLRRAAERLGWNVRITFRIVFAFAAPAIVSFVVLLVLAAFN